MGTIIHLSVTDNLWVQWHFELSFAFQELPYKCPPGCGSSQFV